MKARKFGKEISSEKLKKGTLYRMEHSRKGVAIVEVVEPWKDGGKFIVKDGELRGINDLYLPGDEFTTINNLARFFTILE